MKKSCFALGVLILAVLWLFTPQPSLAAPATPSNLTLERYSFFAALPVALAPSPAPGAAQLAAPAASTFPSCRFGTAVAAGSWFTKTAQIGALSSVGAGWFVDFWSDPPTPAVPAEYTPIVYIKQYKTAAPGCTYLDKYYTYPAVTEDQLGAKVLAQPGALWLIGNEPDRGPDPGKCASNQDDVYPALYARAYHDVYQFIKQHDPTARIANAGLVEFTPGRRQYLDIVWQTYRQLYGVDMPVDVWNMHLYVLPEVQPNGAPNGIGNVAVGTDPALAIHESGGNAALCGDPHVYCFAQHDSLAAFGAQVIAMRTWMKDHGQQQKPLIISEYSLLYPYHNNPADPTACFQDENGNCFDPVRVTNFANATADYLNTQVSSTLGFHADGDRLVQQALWFALNYPAAGYISNLLLAAEPHALTTVGQAFLNKNQGTGPSINLLPTATSGAGGFVRTPGGTVTATLSVEIINNGNMGVTAPFVVTFYRDAARQQPIASVSVPALGGCATHVTTARVLWPDLPAGRHLFWAAVDTGDVVIETNETDNVMPGSVFVGSYGLYLPLVSRP